MSQLDLAAATGVTSRHISFVETGRSTPSRDMLDTLAVALDMPLRDRNELIRRLHEIGATRLYPETFEDNIVLDRRGELRTRGSLLRVRKFGRYALATYKGPMSMAGGIKSREEVQTGVESFELAIQLFDSLGFKPVFRYQKFREVWRVRDVEVVGDTASVAEAEGLIPKLQPDVAVLDARLPDGSGIELCGRLRELAPGVRCLVLTSYDDEEAIVAAIQAGAAGYVLKEVEGDSLLSSVRAVGSGHSLIDPVMARRVIAWIEQTNEGPRELAGLTEQQRKILELLAEGLTNKQIGDRLYLAEKTVKNHVTRILAKLGVQRRTQAALLASRLLPR